DGAVSTLVSQWTGTDQPLMVTCGATIRRNLEPGCGVSTSTSSPVASACPDGTSSADGAGTAWCGHSPAQYSLHHPLHPGRWGDRCSPGNSGSSRVHPGPPPWVGRAPGCGGWLDRVAG